MTSSYLAEVAPSTSNIASIAMGSPFRQDGWSARARRAYCTMVASCRGAGLASRPHPRRRCSMFVVVGRFRFRPMSQEEWQSMLQPWDRDFAPLARESRGFRGVQFVRLSDDEVMTVWQWD